MIPKHLISTRRNRLGVMAREQSLLFGDDNGMAFNDPMWPDDMDEPETGLDEEFDEEGSPF